MPRHVVHTGRKIQVALDVTPLPDGTELRRDVITHPGAVVVLPVLDAGHVVLLRNHRFVIDRTLWEIPAGTLEPDEPPERAAERELAEETGYRAGRWRKLGVYYPSPGVLSEAMHLYVAEDLTPGEAAPEAGEELETHTVPFADALRWCLDGTVSDLKTVAALLMWDRLRAG